MRFFTALLILCSIPMSAWAADLDVPFVSPAEVMVIEMSGGYELQNLPSDIPCGNDTSPLDPAKKFRVRGYIKGASDAEAPAGSLIMALEQTGPSGIWSKVFSLKNFTSIDGDTIHRITSTQITSTHAYIDLDENSVIDDLYRLRFFQGGEGLIQKAVLNPETKQLTYTLTKETYDAFGAKLDSVVVNRCVFRKLE